MSEQTVPTQAGLAPAAAALPGAEPGAPEAPVAPRRRRRRLAVLVILLVLLGVFALFAGWYLSTRKPISELPIVPPVAQATLPNYGFSMYGVASGMGVAVNSAGDRVYATQTSGDNTVKVFDGKGNAIGTATPPETTGAQHVPLYVAVDPVTQDVYVSDRTTGAIYVYSADGVYRRTFDPGTDLKGWQPIGLAFAPDGSMYVTDVGSPFHRVHQFGPDGKLVRSIGEKGMFSFPNGVAVDATGNVYVADSNNGRLRVFAPDGRELGGIPRGAREGDLGLPRGVAIDDSGRIYVVDTTAGAVLVYKVAGPDDRRPTYVGRFGGQGTGDGQFAYPNGVAVDTRGHVLVTDLANNRLQEWSY